jgi:hypothetical protein
MEKEKKLYEFVITYWNSVEDCEDVEIMESTDPKNVRKQFIEEFGNQKILIIEKI